MPRATSPAASIDAHHWWETHHGELTIVRNGCGFGGLVPTFEARDDSRYAYLSSGAYLSSRPSMGQGGVALTFYESVKSR